MSDVLFIDDLAAELRTSRSTIERLRRHRCFPIPEMPSLGRRPRWTREAVEAFKTRTAEASKPKAGKSQAANLRLLKARAR